MSAGQAGRSATRTRVRLAARGVLTAFGAGEEALWEGLLRGESRVGSCPELLPEGARAARVPEEALSRAPGGRQLDRATALAVEAALQLGSHRERRGGERPRLGVCLGTTQGPVRSWEEEQVRLEREPAHRPAEPSLTDPAAAVARLLGADGPVITLSMACASGTAAVGLGLTWLREGRCDAVVAGGVDSLSTMVHTGFGGLRALDAATPRPFDAGRAGLAVGEGAALLLLERCEDRAAEILEVAGHGLSADAHHLTGPDPTGGGLARAIRAALADAALTPEAVDLVNAHGTATVYNDLMEGKALAAVFGPRAASLPVNSIKGAIGHCMAAAGAIEAVFCALVLERGLLPPTAGLARPDPAIPLDLVAGEPRRGDYRVALSTSAGFGGVNAALLLRRG